MKFIFLIFLSVFTKLLVMNAVNTTPHKGPYSQKELIADMLTNDTAKKLLTHQNLHLIGTGGGMMNDIEMLGMDFDYAQEVDLQTARNLLVSALQTYLDTINQNKEIRSYLKNYPFTVNNIEISIFVRTPDDSSIPKDKPTCFSIQNGVLYYYHRDPKLYSSNSFLYQNLNITLHQETYDEAIKLVHTQKHLD